MKKFKKGQIVNKRGYSNEFWIIEKIFKGVSGKTRYDCRSLSPYSRGNTEDFKEEDIFLHPFQTR